MEKKKFSVEDVEMIKENDKFGNDQLLEIVGGKLDAAASADCSKCDCAFSNCNGDK